MHQNMCNEVEAPVLPRLSDETAPAFAKNEHHTQECAGYRNQGLTNTVAVAFKPP